MHVLAVAVETQELISVVAYIVPMIQNLLLLGITQKPTLVKTVQIMPMSLVEQCQVHVIIVAVETQVSISVAAIIVPIQQDLYLLGFSQKL